MPCVAIALDGAAVLVIVYPVEHGPDARRARLAAKQRERRRPARADGRGCVLREELLKELDHQRQEVARAVLASVQEALGVTAEIQPRRHADIID